MRPARSRSSLYRDDGIEVQEAGKEHAGRMSCSVLYSSMVKLDSSSKDCSRWERTKGPRAGQEIQVIKIGGYAIQRQFVSVILLRTSLLRFPVESLIS